MARKKTPASSLAAETATYEALKRSAGNDMMNLGDILDEASKKSLRFGRAGRRFGVVVAFDDLVLYPRVLPHEFTERDLESDLLRLRRGRVYARETIDVADLERDASAGRDHIARGEKG